MKGTGIYEPAVIDSMVAAIGSTYDAGRSKQGLKQLYVNAALAIPQAGMGLIMLVAPPTAIVLGPASIALGGVSVAVERGRSVELGQAVTFAEQAVLAGTGDPQALAALKAQKDAQDFVFGLTVALEAVAGAANVADIVRGVNWAGPYYEGVRRTAGQVAGEAASGAGGAATRGEAGAGAPPAVAGGPQPTPATSAVTSQPTPATSAVTPPPTPVTSAVTPPPTPATSAVPAPPPSVTSVVTPPPQPPSGT
jgi:hypothetical protein